MFAKSRERFKTGKLFNLPKNGERVLEEGTNRTEHKESPFEETGVDGDGGVLPPAEKKALSVPTCDSVMTAWQKLREPCIRRQCLVWILQ